ncbi:hypothetical protein C1H46_045405 [Malus baccata]|uniref:Uncharacterized protein n=1 Tax=Malus baccata TaxID=106549 RepID=A0A540K5A5_MALBA|nr:hypothetical protein C1H46_045405 [Malus baccata]
MQEEIKITSVTIFVNPYTEPDEEEEEKAKAQEKAQDEDNDKVGSWYSNPGTGTESGPGGGGGVGKYLKAKNALPESAAVDAGLQELPSTKKRKSGVSASNFNDFSSW